jgi:glycosyltransferase involved in cell wall biosynthesis
MENMPLCSVVMSVYNGEVYLKEAIDSILQQSYDNFEFIIIDDASSDGSLEIILSYKDSRIVLIQNEKNLFLAASLNKGIRIAKGKYIVRMDADDISMKDRLLKQVSFMESNPQVGISGTCSEIIGHGSGFGNYSQDDQTIKFKLLHECHLLHPTLILRKELIFENNLFYNEEYRKNQDYELFVRAIDITEFANLPDRLIKYRQTEDNVKREVHNQKENVLILQKKLFHKIGIEVTDHKLHLYKLINKQEYPQSKEFLIESCEFLQLLVYSNNEKRFFTTEKFEAYINNLFENVCRNVKGTGLIPFKFYLKSNISHFGYYKVKLLVILFLKGILVNK